MEYSHDDFLKIVREEFDEDYEISGHYSWGWDEETNSIQGYCTLPLMNFFTRCIGHSFTEKDFSADIKIDLLNSAVNELQDFFSVKANSDKYPKIFLELFYTEKRVVEIICNEGVKLGFWKVNEVPKKIYSIINLNLQIPKIKLQWNLFVILSTMTRQGKDLKKLSNRFLGLKPTRSKEPIEIDVFNVAQERLRNFAHILKKYEIAKYEGYNLSLNLFCFNQITNLLDLVQIVYGVQENNLKSFDLVEIMELEGLAIKDSFITGGLYGEILSDSSTLIRFNRIFKECKDLLEKMFEDMAAEDSYGLPNNIAKAFVTYKYLSNDSSYEDNLLKKYTKLSDKKYQVDSEEFALFGMLYKEIHRKNAKKS